MEEGLGYTLLPASAIRAELAAKRLEMAILVNPTVSRELVHRHARRQYALDRHDGGIHGHRVGDRAAVAQGTLEDQAVAVMASRRPDACLVRSHSRMVARQWMRRSWIG